MDLQVNSPHLLCKTKTIGGEQHCACDKVAELDARVHLLEEELEASRKLLSMAKDEIESDHAHIADLTIFCQNLISRVNSSIDQMKNARNVSFTFNYFGHIRNFLEMDNLLNANGDHDEFEVVLDDLQKNYVQANILFRGKILNGKVQDVFDVESERYTKLLTDYGGREQILRAVLAARNELREHNASGGVPVLKMVGNEGAPLEIDDGVRMLISKIDACVKRQRCNVKTQKNFKLMLQLIKKELADASSSFNSIINKIDDAEK